SSPCQSASGLGSNGWAAKSGDENRNRHIDGRKIELRFRSSLFLNADPQIKTVSALRAASTITMTPMPGRSVAGSRRIREGQRRAHRLDGDACVLAGVSAIMVIG